MWTMGARQITTKVRACSLLAMDFKSSWKVSFIHTSIPKNTAKLTKTHWLACWVKQPMSSSTPFLGQILGESFRGVIYEKWSMNEKEVQRKQKDLIQPQKFNQENSPWITGLIFL